MKTNNLTKKSLLTTMILALSSVFMGSKAPAQHNLPNGYVGGGSPFYNPKRTQFKGYMRERRLGSRRSKYYFNKNK